MNTVTPPSSPSKIPGFTLIEMVGVLAIISIMASMAVPPIIERIRRANSAKESQTLATLGEALQSAILANQSIPDESAWAQVIADELSVPLREVTHSVGQQPRVYWVDPAITIGGQTGVLPYTQTGSGSSVQPLNFRVMIVSSRFLPLPVFLTSGIANSADDFEKLWNTARWSIPSGWPSEWSQYGEELHVERLNFASLFCQVVVNDITEGVAAEIAVDDSPVISIPAGGLGGYYFKGTEIAFLNDGAIESRELIDRDLSYTYERGIWRGQLWEGRAKDATDLAAALDRFRLSRILQKASGVSSQQLVIDAYYNYALLYASWARAGFPTYDDQQEISPLYESLLDAQSQLELLSGNLVLN